MRIFIAGATGATGQVFVPLASKAGIEQRLHVRPQSVAKTSFGKDPRARVFDLSDRRALASALSGCEAVISFVGTMRSRFKAGDTYESSDIGSTRFLVEGASAANVPRFLLLSSVGAGGAGAYLKMKAECERIVRASGLRYTIFRPSALVSPREDEAEISHHGRRQNPAVVGWMMSTVGALPGLGAWATRFKPIPISVVCRAFLRVLEKPHDGTVIEGQQLWTLGAEHSRVS
jgi:uncharacterized protein YbjT (DUF2867 family)